MAKKLDQSYSRRIKPFNYIDIIYTKRGKLRTWRGHLRAIRQVDPKTLPFRFEGYAGPWRGVYDREKEDA